MKLTVMYITHVGGCYLQPKIVECLYFVVRAVLTGRLNIIYIYVPE